MLAAEKKKWQKVMEAVEVPASKKDRAGAKGKGVEGSTSVSFISTSPTSSKVLRKCV